MVTINGKTYKGNNVSMINNKVFIDGKEVTGDDSDSKVINIKIEGNIETLSIDSCDKLDVIGDCGVVNSKNGNISISGNVNGDVTNKNGNISCGNVSGDVDNKNGNISHR
jgi:hypothetical protein